MSETMRLPTAASRFGIDYGRLYAAVRRNTLPASQGRDWQWHVRPEDVERLIAADPSILGAKRLDPEVQRVKALNAIARLRLLRGLPRLDRDDALAWAQSLPDHELLAGREIGPRAFAWIRAQPMMERRTANSPAPASFPCEYPS